MKVAKGMQVNLFASEEQFPNLINPVQAATDTERPSMGRGLAHLSALASQQTTQRQVVDLAGRQTGDGKC